MKKKTKRIQILKESKKNKKVNKDMEKIVKEKKRNEKR